MKTTIGVLPYVAQVRTVVCNCRTEPKLLGRSKTPEGAIRRAEPYWNVFLGFFGDQIVWLRFEVIDLRDGTVLWRNGKNLVEESNGKGIPYAQQ